MEEKRTIMPTEDINLYNQMINVGYPTDIIDIPDTIERRLFEMAGVIDIDIVPNDIIMCKTISIEDLILNEITPSMVLEKLKSFAPSIVADMRKIPIRIKLFSNWKNIVDDVRYNNGKTSSQPIGVLMMECHQNSWIYKTFCISYNSLVITEGIGYKIDDDRNKTKSKRVMTELVNMGIIKDDEHIKQMFNRMLKLWYSVQIAMLNPITMDIFSRGERHAVIEHQETRKKKQKKTKIKYIRKHIIKPEEFDDAFDIKIGNNTFTRKTMIWHVAGHWREYKNGKKVFINGYWKGPLKDIKNTDARERELVLSK